MSITPGTYTLGPDNAKLVVNTGRAGAAAKAGHDLVIEVTKWNGTLELGEDPSASSVTLTADGGSLRVREGKGGIQSLGDDDKEGIEQTIDDEILKSAAIEFRSAAVQAAPGGDHLRVSGELKLASNERPLEFELVLAPDGRLTGSATVKQSDWGIKPYSTLFGTLKVADEVKVTIDANIGG